MARVLVIDDVASVRGSIASYLEDLDHDVQQADNGVVGLELAKVNPPDLAIVDLRMPGISGLEVLHHLHTLDENLPVLIVSGTGEIRDAIEALRKGAWNFILKPIVDMDVMKHAVDQALERRRLRSENAQYAKNLESEVARKTTDLKCAILQLEREVEIRRKAERAAVLSEERLASLVRAVPDVIFQLDAEFKILFLSDAISQYGLNPADWMAQYFVQLFMPEDRETLAFRLKGILSASNGVVRLEARIKNKSGTIAYLEIFADTTEEEQTANGSAQRRVLGVARDITSKVQVDRELKEAAERMRQSQKMEIMGQLASGVAHDFNNLLTAIVGNAELIHNSRSATADVQGKADAILRTSERASGIIRQLLAFGRRQPSEKSVLKLNDVLREAVAILSHTMDRSVEISTEFSNENMEVVADLAQLESAIVNLGINARDAMPKGGSLILRTSIAELNGDEHTLGLRCEPGSYVQIDVIDNGTGMDDQIRKRIFEPFFTTKPPGKGTGLGMSAVYTFIQNHFGTLRVTSALNRGTCVSLFLPHNACLDADSVPSTKIGTLIHGSGTVLIADDQEVVRNFAERALRELGYKVLTASNGVDAVDIYQQQKSVDLVVLDLRMPGLDGFGAFKRIKAIDPAARVVLSSGTIDRDIESSFKEEGGEGTLWKPFGVAYLSQVVARALQRN